MFAIGSNDQAVPTFDELLANVPAGFLKRRWRLQKPPVLFSPTTQNCDAHAFVSGEAAEPLTPPHARRAVSNSLS